MFKSCKQIKKRLIKVNKSNSSIEPSKPIKIDWLDVYFFTNPASVNLLIRENVGI